MRKRLTLAVASLALAAAAIGATSLPAGAHSTAVRDGHRHFVVGVVHLTGAQEVPPADPDGFGTFAFIGFKSTLCYVLTAHNIEPATMAHIHPGARGVNGPIVIALMPPTDGVSFDCIQAVSNDTPNTPAVLLQSELDAIIANPAAFYSNVHNAPFPAGAIRGQLR
jgi:hypothetical protein